MSVFYPEMPIKICRCHVPLETIMESYPFPDLKDVEFGDWSWQLQKKGADAKTSVLKTKAAGDGCTTFVVRNVTFNYTPKPENLPRDKSTHREGNSYVHGAYQAWEPLQVAAHVTEDYAAAAEPACVAYAATACKLLWDTRKDVWPRKTPKVRADLDIKAFKYAHLITELAAPRGAPADASSHGINFQAVGWGGAVDKAVVLRTGNAEAPERVGWCTFVPQESGPDVPGEMVTKFWLVVDTTAGPQFISEVPWTEDGDIGTDSPTKIGLDGEDVWRKVGPQDLKRGSIGDVVLTHKSLLASDGTGSVNKRLVAQAIYFRLPKHDEGGFKEPVSVSESVEPPPSAIPARDAVRALLATQFVSGSADGAPAAAAAVPAPAAAAPLPPPPAVITRGAPATPIGKAPHTLNVNAMFEHTSKRKRDPQPDLTEE